MKHFPIKIESTQQSNTLEIRWNPNNVCNFKCRYCFPGSNAANFKSPTDLDLVIKNFRHLLNYYNEKLGKTRIQLKIAGGEPTLWRELGLFVEAIKAENDVYVSIISNGSRTTRWWKDHGHAMENVHLTHHVSQGNIDHIIEVADIMYEFGNKITVKVLMDPTCWDACVAAVEYLKKNSKYSWFITIAEVIEPDHTHNFTSEQKSYMKKGLQRMTPMSWFWKNRHLITSGEIKYFESIATMNTGKILKASSQTYINENWNNFKGWACDIASENFYIDWNGDLKGACNQLLFGLDFCHNILSPDFVEKFNVEFVPVICASSECVCPPETHASKIKLI